MCDTQINMPEKEEFNGAIKSTSKSIHHRKAQHV